MNIISIIPARMGSSRFPGKPMAEILGKPMIGHVYDNVKKNQLIADVAVATCDDEIYHYIESIGGRAIMTSSEHERASDRCAGVYGRQEPMSFSTPADKRDLMVVFGLDRIIQKKDSFFHNANSIVKRKLWVKVPFDAETTNIEDRLWAQEMLNMGYHLMYEPLASVYHYHGIHQDGNSERLTNVVRIIEDSHPHLKSGKLDANKLEIVAIIPVRGQTRVINDKPLLNYTIEAARKSKYIDRVIVSTDCKETIDIAKEAGAECPFIRPPKMSEKHVNLETVQQYSLEKLEEDGYIPDLIVHLEETFPLRPDGLIDGMIDHLLRDGFDSVIVARRESGFLWKEESEGKFIQIDSGDVPRQYKESTLVGIHGLGCITHPEFIRGGRILGDNIGLYQTDYPIAGFEVRDDISANIAGKLL